MLLRVGDPQRRESKRTDWMETTTRRRSSPQPSSHIALGANYLVSPFAVLLLGGVPHSRIRRGAPARKTMVAVASSSSSPACVHSPQTHKRNDATLCTDDQEGSMEYCTV